MADAEVTEVNSGPHQVSRRVTVHAPASELFALVADPHRHPELDGSGTVRHNPVKGPSSLQQGDKFSVAMKQYGVPYKITSTVTALEPDRLVEWQHPMGHKWRWEFADDGSGSTQVTETFDYSTARSAKFLEIVGQPAKNGVGITNTLKALAARFG